MEGDDDVWRSVYILTWYHNHNGYKINLLPHLKLSPSFYMATLRQTSYDHFSIQEFLLFFLFPPSLNNYHLNRPYHTSSIHHWLAVLPTHHRHRGRIFCGNLSRNRPLELPTCDMQLIWNWFKFWQSPTLWAFQGNIVISLGFPSTLRSIHLSQWHLK